MAEVYEATLILQDIARDLHSERAAGVAPNDPEHAARLAAWADARMRIISIPPADGADALASIHSLLQVATALLNCSEHPESVQALGTACRDGLEALAKGLEDLMGESREAMGLFANFTPPGGIN